LHVSLKGQSNSPPPITTSSFADILRVFIDRALVVIKSVIFADALISAIMQDGGKRERSIYIISLAKFKEENKKTKL